MPRDSPDFRIYHVPSLLNQHHSLSANELDTSVIFFPSSFVSEESKALQTYSKRLLMVVKHAVIGAGTHSSEKASQPAAETHPRPGAA